MMQNNKSCCAPARSEQPHAQSADATSALTQGVSTHELVELAGGTFLMGTDSAESFPHDGEGPVRPVTLSPFRISRSPVTNQEFAQFVQATGYRTDAERFGWSFVFWAHVPPARFQQMVQDTVAAAPWWCRVADAAWSSPEGPGSDVATRADHPVTHVSWIDASAFCAWAGLRLPTEAEWEYAARGGLAQKLYPWGDKLRPNSEHRANIWQGDFPQQDTGDDGYTGTCPVAAFPANGYGLYSMTGNTWEWCSDWFSTEHPRGALANPEGPAEGQAKVIKGGSFLCHKSYCNRYRVAARSSNTPDSSTAHMGFRCAQDV